MSNEKANVGIKEILRKFNEEDLFALASTVTQGLLRNKVTTKEGAIEIILKYSPDELSILKRRALTRDVLFSYLHDNNINVVLPVTKDKLIDKICSHWGLTPQKHFDSIDTNVERKDELERRDEVNVMAHKFSEWFYSIMNQNEKMGPEHFYPDAKITLRLISGTQHMTEEVESSEEIVRLLFKTKSKHNLYFNPNLNDDGVQGRIDVHGLVVILSCGTLHSNDACAGVFEQVFSLARDPFSDNNWKIKETQLNLRSVNDVHKPPSLCDVEMMSDLLKLPDC